jgi:hypothetical protein
MIQPFHNQLDEWEEIRVKTADSVAGTRELFPMRIPQPEGGGYGVSTNQIFFLTLFPPAYK